jgi:hypothetical protein
MSKNEKIQQRRTLIKTKLFYEKNNCENFLTVIRFTEMFLRSFVYGYSI